MHGSESAKGKCENSASRRIKTKNKKDLELKNLPKLEEWRLLRSVHRLLVTANVVPSSPILVTLMMEALSSYETSVLTRATRRKFQEDVILHSHSCETSNLAYFLQNSIANFYVCWVLLELTPKMLIRESCTVQYLTQLCSGMPRQDSPDPTAGYFRRPVQPPNSSPPDPATLINLLRHGLRWQLPYR
jgi:hypothetical protein